MNNITETIKTIKNRNEDLSDFSHILPNWTDYSIAQKKVLEVNFSKDGCFFRSIDVHTMLDCGPSPEMILIRPINIEIPPKIKLASRLILREEFFGGIIYDLDRHALFYLDRLAMSIVLLVHHGLENDSIFSVLAHNGWSHEETLLAIQDLTTQSLLNLFEGNSDLPKTKIFKASDLSVPYLQAPFIVELEMTHACYRECTHCAYDASPRANRKGELSTEKWKEIIDKLANEGVLSIRFTGGDFMYRSDAIELLEYTDTLDIAYHFLSDTIALNERNLCAVKQLKNLAYIGTSIDGPDNSTHDAMRGIGAFDLLVERVQRITSEGIQMSLGTTLHKQNWRYVRETGKLAQALGATYFEVGFLCPIGRGANLKEQVLNGEEVRASLQLYLDGVRAGEYSPMQLHYYARAHKTDVTAFSDLSEIVDRLPFQTEWPFSRLRVKPDGTTYTAGKLKESGLSIGINILYDDLKVIWKNSPNLVALRKLGVGRRLHSLDISDLPKELHHD